jgi:hypothetical protein
MSQPEENPPGHIPLDVVLPIQEGTTNRRSKRIYRSKVNVILAPEGPEFNIASAKSMTQNPLLEMLIQSMFEVTEEEVHYVMSDRPVPNSDFDEMELVNIWTEDPGLGQGADDGVDPNAHGLRHLTEEELRALATPTVINHVDYSNKRKSSDAEKNLVSITQLWKRFSRYSISATPQEFLVFLTN